MKIQCPICSTVLEDVPDDWGPRPFCSKRCKLLDLGNWLTEKYRLPRAVEPHELEDDERLN